MPKGKYIISNYLDQYGSIMQFNQNKNTYIHGWYPFVEGYSKEFIHSIIQEFENLFSRKPNHCLEPFAGSGTTPLELQKLDIKCTSFEVSPFMYNLAIVKMETKYTLKKYNECLNSITESLQNYIEDVESIISPPNAATILERDGLKKWNFNKEVMKGILDIKYAINQLNSTRYKNLFLIALASILLDVSNVYRNGKCISYKKDWKNSVKYSRTDVHRIYLEKLMNSFYPDLVKLNKYKKNIGKLFTNSNLCYLGDVRKLLDRKVEDKSVDLVITSPPYLNSRDYTDTYMIELRMLGYMNDNDDLRKLRKRTIRSHVQIKWNNVRTPGIDLLKEEINELSKHTAEFWNVSLLNMIKGYFQDMNTLFKILSKKMLPEGMVYFNVANSCYYGVEIKTDEIIAAIAEKNGFHVKEIREARRISPSSQQKDSIPFLRESVIVMQK